MLLLFTTLLKEENEKKKNPIWANGLTSREQIYVMGIANQEVVIVKEIDYDGLDDYKKQAKRVSKQFKI